MKPVRVLVHPSDSLANIEARLREAGFKRAAVAEAGKLVRVISIDGYRPGRARGLVERDSRGCHDWGADQRRGNRDSRRGAGSPVGSKGQLANRLRRQPAPRCGPGPDIGDRPRVSIRGQQGVRGWSPRPSARSQRTFRQKRDASLTVRPLVGYAGASNQPELCAHHFPRPWCALDLARG
jgi:hypothetical protein